MGCNDDFQGSYLITATTIQHLYKCGVNQTKYEQFNMTSSSVKTKMFFLLIIYYFLATSTNARKINDSSILDISTLLKNFQVSSKSNITCINYFHLLLSLNFRLAMIEEFDPTMEVLQCLSMSPSMSSLLGK